MYILCNYNLIIIHISKIFIVISNAFKLDVTSKVEVMSIISVQTKIRYCLLSTLFTATFCSYLKMPRYNARVYITKALEVIGYRLHNNFEIVASTKFPGVGHALKQRASMQVM